MGVGGWVGGWVGAGADVGCRGNALGDEVTARLRAEFAKLGEWIESSDEDNLFDETGLRL